MLLHSLKALCNAPGGAGSIWEYLEAVVRATRVSGRVAYGFRTELHFADVQILHSYCGLSERYTAMNGIVLFSNRV